MSFGQGSNALIGSPTIPISEHPPEFWAERLAAQIERVADTASQPIRDQANTFKEAIYIVCLHTIRQAQESAVAQLLHSRKAGV